MRGSPSRGEQRKAAIADAALELFVERGFGAVTVDDVARAAGASKTTISRFFGGRRGLVAAALEREMALVFAPLADAAPDPARFAETLHDVVFSDRCLRLLQFVIGEAGTDPAVGEAFDAVVITRLRSLLEPALAGRARAGGTTAAALAGQLLDDLIGVELLRALTGGAPSAERLAELRERALERLPGGAG